MHSFPPIDPKRHAELLDEKIEIRHAIPNRTHIEIAMSTRLKAVFRPDAMRRMTKQTGIATYAGKGK